MEKITVTLASILAGAGHNSVRKMFFEELTREPDFKVLQFTHSKEYLNKVYDATSQHLARISNFSYKNLPNELVALITLNLLDECVKYLNEVKPDIVIATHFLIGLHFTLAKIFAEKKAVIYSAITDYGDVPPSIFPYSKKIRPDYLLVFDEQTRTSLIKNYNLPENSLILTGFKPSQPFLNQQDKYKDKVQAREQILQRFPDNPYLQIKPDKGTILISAGSGGTINKSHELLNEIVSAQKKNSELIKKFQYFVICGINKKFFQLLLQKNSSEYLWNNIFPFSWLNAEDFALLQYACDFPILVSVGFAILNELLATKTGPLLVYSTRGGQETNNLDFLLKNNLGLFLPESKELLDKILKGFTSNEQQLFLQKAEKHLQIQNTRVLLISKDIKRKYGESRGINTASALENSAQPWQFFKKYQTSPLFRNLIFAITILSIFLSIFAYLGLRSVKKIKKVRK